MLQIQFRFRFGSIFSGIQEAILKFSQSFLMSSLRRGELMQSMLFYPLLCSLLPQTLMATYMLGLFIIQEIKSRRCGANSQRWWEKKYAAKLTLGSFTYELLAVGDRIDQSRGSNIPLHSATLSSAGASFHPTYDIQSTASEVICCPLQQVSQIQLLSLLRLEILSESTEVWMEKE